MINFSLFKINLILNQKQRKHTEFPDLPQLPKDYDQNISFSNFEKNSFLRQHLSYDKEYLKLFSSDCIKKLNKDQTLIYISIINNKPNDKNGDCYFLDGPGGK